MKKLEEDLPLKFYDRAYKTHYARINSGKMTKQEFFLWHQEAKEKDSIINSVGEIQLSLIGTIFVYAKKRT